MRFFGIDGVVMQISRRLVEEIEIYICFFKRIIILLIILLGATLAPRDR